MFCDASATSRPPIISEIVEEDQQLLCRPVADSICSVKTAYSLWCRDRRVLFVASPVLKRGEDIEGIWIQPRGDCCDVVRGNVIKRGASRARNTAVRMTIRMGQTEEKGEEIG
jgi:hypothetical protein